MTRRAHPITELVLAGLIRDEAGRLSLGAQGRLHEALAAAAREGAIRPAVLALVELAFVVEHELDGAEVARALRQLCAEHAPELQEDNARRREVKRQKIERFSRFSGQAPRAARLPQASKVQGGLRVADLLGPRPIYGR